MAPPPSAATALRESFGDRKLPDITRKITACVSCRKLKIRCQMSELNKPPCDRCKARGIPCTINKSLQMILENDASWKEAMEERMERLEQALMSRSDSDQPMAMSTLQLERNRLEVVPRPTASLMSTRDLSSAHLTTEATDGTTLNLSCSLGAFPASSVLTPTLFDEQLYTRVKPDLVSRGLISLEAAEGYFSYYKQNLDPCIHHILKSITSLAEVRAASSVLTAAICTVATFSTGSKDYENCYSAYTTEVSGKLFSNRYEFDDVRALCIGAYWLNDISSALNGLAVRIATQLDLHRCITKMPHTKRACYDRTRLFFLVYLCDHHCSLAYGRPPMTREFRSLKNPGVFLQSEFSTRADLNLICQVELWSISRRVFEHFGADIESSIVSQRYAELELLSKAYDTWHRDWLQPLTAQDEPDSFPRCVFNLYFHAAKLYLFSHIFRDPSQMDGDFREKFAESALQSALSIVRCITNENEAQPWLEQLPCYFGTMVAFASVCLIKTVFQGHQSDGLEHTDKILECFRRLVDIINMSSLSKYPTNRLLGIAKGVEMATSELRRPRQGQFDGLADGNLANTMFNFDLFTSDNLSLSTLGDRDDWMMSFLYPGHESSC